MILDKTLFFDTASAITANATTQASAFYIDQLYARDLGIGDGGGEVPKLRVQATAAFTTTNSATLNIQFQGSSDNTTWTTYAETGVLGTAPALNQIIWDIDVPRPIQGGVRPEFYRLQYTVGTGSFSAGAVTAFIVLGRDDIPQYPPGITVAN